MPHPKGRSADNQATALKWLLVTGGGIAILDVLFSVDEQIRTTVTFCSGIVCLLSAYYLVKASQIRRTMYVCSLSTACVYLGNFILFGEVYHFAIGFSIPIAAAIFVHWKDALIVGTAYVVLGTCIGLLLHFEVLSPTYEPRPVLDKTISAFLLIGLMTSIAIWKEQLLKKAADREARQTIRFETICDNAYGTLLEADSTGHIVFARGRLLRDLGFAESQILGRHQLDFLTKEDRHRLRKTASRVDGEFKYDSEVQLIDANENKRWIRLSGGTIGSHEGNRRWVSAIQDIQAEVEQRQNAAEHLHVESLSNICTGLSHEFNNLLTAIRIHASTIDDPQIRKDILRAQRQASDLTSDLLAFGKRQESLQTSFAMKRAMPYLQRLVQNIAPDNVNTLWEIHTDQDIDVHLDANQFEQVLVNLVSNACESMAEGGELSIEVKQTIVTRKIAKSRSIAEGDFLEVVCRDTGCGMEATTASRAVEPFFTTKPRGTCTGLGLATAHGTIRAAGGSLQIRSKPNHGTEVSVLIPIQKNHLPQEAPGQRFGETPQHRVGHVVILVEDREIVSTAIKMTLEKTGFVVQTYCDAESAWERIESGASFDLLISDIALPGMSGVELLQRCLGPNPDLKVIVMSGLPHHGLRVLTEHPETVRFLAKPFHSSHLLAVALELVSLPSHERQTTPMSKAS